MKVLIIYLFFNMSFVDVKTQEPLTGVRVQTEKSIYYSDFDGNVKIPNDEKICNVSFISYQSINETFCPKDSTIKLFSK